MTTGSNSIREVFPFSCPEAQKAASADDAAYRRMRMKWKVSSSRKGDVRKEFDDRVWLRQTQLSLKMDAKATRMWTGCHPLKSQPGPCRSVDIVALPTQVPPNSKLPPDFRSRAAWLLSLTIIFSRTRLSHVPTSSIRESSIYIITRDPWLGSPCVDSNLNGPGYLLVTASGSLYFCLRRCRRSETTHPLKW